MKPNTDNLVEIRNLSFSRNGRQIFDGINISVERKKITAVMGPSGAGKTTLLQLIGGQLMPEAGTVIVDGKSVPNLSRSSLYHLRKQMGMLFQSGALFSDLNVFENVAFPLREHTNLPEPLIRDLVLMKLQAVGLRGARNLMPSQLSGGMARRVALARALALDPGLIMFDEPFAGQDPISMGMLVKLIRSLNDSLRLTSIVVSHDVHETIAIADYIYLIAEGRVVGQGTPEEIMKDQSGWVKQFMHALPDGPAPFHYPASEYRSDLMGTET